MGSVSDLFQLALDNADQAVQVGAAKLTIARLSSDQMPSRVELGHIGGQPVDPQPRLVLSGELGELGRGVDVEVVPVLCPAVLCGQRRLASGVTGGGRLGGAAAGHIMITARRAS